VSAPDGALILGIDPGTRVLGFGAIRGTLRAPALVGAGVVRVNERRPVHERLARMANEIAALLEELRPHTVVVERAFAGRNLQSALRLGECRGIVLAAASRSGAAVEELSPAQAKRAIAGHGAATKERVADLVALRLGLARNGAPLDATDALALALAWQQGVATPLVARRTARATLGRELLARLASTSGLPAPGVAALGLPAGLQGANLVLSRRRPR